MKKDIVQSDGSIETVEMTQEEIELLNRMNETSNDNANLILEHSKIFEERAAIRQSALAKLTVLGLTEEEIASL